MQLRTLGEVVEFNMPIKLESTSPSAPQSMLTFSDWLFTMLKSHFLTIGLDKLSDELGCALHTGAFPVVENVFINSNANAAYWFLAGSLFILVVYMLWILLREEKKI